MNTAFNTPDSPIALTGTITMLIAYVIAAWGATAGIVGNATKRPRLVVSSVYALYAFGALASLAASLIIYGFVTHDYAIKYVAHTSDTTMSLWYKITAFWGGLDGSLLFWIFVLAVFSMIAVAMNYRRHRDMIGYVVGTIMTVQVFFVTLIVFHKNPFATFLTSVPLDGQGLNPLLQNYWMIIHPPSLYVGFVAATIPFAFGVAALASGRLDDMWLSSVRVWVLICFAFLSLGLILGGRWAYEELGWGGYWAWDPVENAGFMPWFLATAFLHSAIIQEQRGMMKGWNVVLVVLTFLFTIFGTFMTRSGIVQSVHAFGEDKVLALQFVIFMALIGVIAVGLIAYRWPRLRSQGSLDSFLSREFSFLLNNWILLSCALFVLFATMYPTMLEALTGNRATVGIEFYNRNMVWFGLALLLLLGAAPLLAWRTNTPERLLKQFAWPVGVAVATVVGLAILVPQSRTYTTISLMFQFSIRLPIPLLTLGLIAFSFTSITQEFIKGVSVRHAQTGQGRIVSLFVLLVTKRRKYGGYVVHLGMVIMFLGFVGKAYEHMIDRTIDAPALAATANADHPAWFSYEGYRFLYEQLTTTSDDQKSATTARVSVWKGGEKLGTLFPAQWSFFKGSQPTTEVAIHSRFPIDITWSRGKPWKQVPLDVSLHATGSDSAEDVYLVLTGFEKNGQANFRVYINPLINFVWLGFMIFWLGTGITLIPQRLADIVSTAFSSGNRSRLGRAAEAAVFILAFGGIFFAMGRSAMAEPDPGTRSDQFLEVGPDQPVPVLAQAAEHDMGGMGDGQGHAHKFRPPTDDIAKVMKDLVCMCGGCQRENIYECKCGYAANERGKVLDMFNQGLTPPQVMQAFVGKYGTQVLATPPGTVSWMIPVLAAIGGLGLLFFVARSWVARGKRAMATSDAAAKGADDEDLAYADQLEEELAHED